MDGDGSAAGLSAEDARIEIAGAGAPRSKVVDVRSMDNFAEAHIPGALLTEDGDAEAVRSAISDVEGIERWVVVCADGDRSRDIAQELAGGDIEVAWVEGGMDAWADAGNSTQPPEEH